MILVDTGPLVALIHEDDNEHRICKDTFLTFSEPLGTVWPVFDRGPISFEFLMGSPKRSLGDDSGRRRRDIATRD